MHNDDIITQFNYIFFFDIADYYRIMFKDIAGMKNIRLVSGNEVSNKAFRFLRRVHFSKKINHWMNLPQKEIWNKFYFTDDFLDDKPKIFVFHGSFYRLLSVDYFSYLRSVYPDCICILLFTDTIDSYDKAFGNDIGFSIDLLKKNFDWVLSYNAEDAKKYDFMYYPLWYSRIELPKVEKDIDVFFIGRAKDRLDSIHEAYLRLSNLGLRCKFIICDVARQNQQYDDILYNQNLSYDEVLQYVNRSKGLLEICQGGATGFTLRLLEALSYDKNLITDNRIIDVCGGELWTASPKIIRYEKTMNISKEQYEKTAEETYRYNGQYSPKHLLKMLAECARKTSVSRGGGSS